MEVQISKALRWRSFSVEHNLSSSKFISSRLEEFVQILIKSDVGKVSDVKTVVLTEVFFSQLVEHLDLFHLSWNWFHVAYQLVIGLDSHHSFVCTYLGCYLDILLFLDFSILDWNPEVDLLPSLVVLEETVLLPSSFVVVEVDINQVVNIINLLLVVRVIVAFVVDLAYLDFLAVMGLLAAATFLFTLKW